MNMRFLTVLFSILTLAAASPVRSLQRRAHKAISFNIQQQFILQPSSTQVVSLWGGVQTYFQGDGNLGV